MNEVNFKGQGMHLDANENQYGSSEKAVRAMEKVIGQANTYPSPMGEELVEALAGYHGIKPENIVLGNGSSTILEKIGAAFIEPGDEVITCLPTFMVYIMIIQGCKGKPVICSLTEDKKFDLKAMMDAVTDRTKMVWICNPNNPTGTALDGEELETFIRALPKHIITVVDEAYIDFAEEGKCPSMMKLINERKVIVTRTFSKIYGLAGIRVGYAVAGGELSGALRSRMMIFNVNKAGIAGAYAALEDRDYYEFCRKKHMEGRRYMTKELTEMGFRVYESQASFLYMDAPAGTDVEEIDRELKSRGIFTNMRPGNIRISLGTEEQNRYLIQSLKEILKEQ